MVMRSAACALVASNKTSTIGTTNLFMETSMSGLLLHCQMTLSAHLSNEVVCSLIDHLCVRAGARFEAFVAPEISRSHCYYNGHGGMDPRSSRRAEEPGNSPENQDTPDDSDG